ARSALTERTPTPQESVARACHLGVIHAEAAPRDPGDMRAAIFTWVLGAAGCAPGTPSTDGGVPPDASTAPVIASPLVATLSGGVVTFEGARFGTAGPGSDVILIEAGGTTTRIASPDVAAWQDTQITLAIPPSATSGSIGVETPSGVSAPIPLEVYA